MNTEAILEEIERKMEDDERFEAIVSPFFDAGFAVDSFGELRSDYGDHWAVVSGNWIEIGSHSSGKVRRVRL